MITDFVYYQLSISGNDPNTITSTLVEPLMLMASIADQNKISYILEKVTVIVMKDEEDYDETT